jgi:hypothetical protein
MTLKRGLRSFEGRTVVVHNAPGPSIRGVLLHAHRDCLIVAHADSLDDQADLGGEVVIPRTPGLWLQVPAPEPAP